jgi:hypothetical protein
MPEQGRPFRIFPILTSLDHRLAGLLIHDWPS